MATCRRCGQALPDGARFCPSCGAPVDVSTAGDVEERKLATVLFADLVGSTERAGDQDPERTRATLDRFYEAMAAEIEAAGGTVEKFAGDAVMAAFGAPAAHEDHAERALHAAFAMHERLRALFAGELALRIGVDTGEVVVGRAREGSSFVSGDTVNCAARLEQAAEPDEVLAGERTLAAARGAFEFGAPRRIEAKGKGDGLVAVPVVRALSLTRPRGVSGLQRAFVGRDAELELLLATYGRTVRQGDPHLVTVMADAGVGKSRLMRELWDRLGAESPEPLRRSGRCLPYGRGITYWPLGEILKEHLEILESDSPEHVRDRLGDRAILGLTLGLDVAGELHPLAARDRLHEAWIELLEQLASERPVVLLVEDIHWAEEPLLHLLERLARDVRGPLFVLATARPELLDSRPSWGGGMRNASLLGLEPLAADDTGRMLGELLGTALPAELQHTIVERAEGNPFFVEELLGTLIDRGVLARRDGEWEVDEQPAGFDVPDSVHAVVAARMDLLPAQEKAALQAAAVTGRVFWAGPVAELLDGDEPDFAAIEDRDFIRRRTGSALEGEREYAFKHAVTREVAYASVPKARRAHLHARFAAWLERLGKPEEHAPLLAHHYAESVQSGDVDLAWGDAPEEVEALRAKAAHWLRRAGELAVGRYDLEEGIALLRRALELEPDEGRHAELWRVLAHAHALNYDGRAFWTAIQTALDRCQDRRLEGSLYADLVFETAIRSGMWPQMPDSELVESWIEKALELVDPESVDRAKALVAAGRWNPEGRTAVAAEASALAERVGDAALRSYAFDVRGITAFVAGEYELGRAMAERRFELLDEISDPDHRADIYATPITGCIWSGRFREARRLARSHDEIASRLTAHHRVHAVAILLEVEELAGGWAAIAELQNRADSAVADNLATPCVRNPRSLLLCATARLHAGDVAVADDLEERAREIWMEGYGSTLSAPLLRLAVVRGDLDRVAELIEPPMLRGWHRGWFFFSAVATQLDALAALRDSTALEAEAPRHLRPGTYLEPFALRSLGVVREDQRLVEQAAERFDALSLDWHAEQTRALLAS